MKDKETNETLATYRLLCSKFTSKFYSENEFNLNKLLDNNKVKLELGRACVATSKRRTNVVYLIWKGLATYMNEVNSDYVFGCTSLNTVDYNTAMAVYDFLKKEHFDDRFNINPLQEYAFNEIEKKESTEFINEEQASLLIPTLLKSYISAGSKICSLPAIDRDFNCVDLFTILDLENITPKYHKKYFSHFSSN